MYEVADHGKASIQVPSELPHQTLDLMRLGGCTCRTRLASKISRGKGIPSSSMLTRATLKRVAKSSLRIQALPVRRPINDMIVSRPM